MKILIVKLGSIGDIVHTLPALAAIREALPDADIGWVVEKRSAEILRGNRMIERLIEVDTRMLRGGKMVAKILPVIRDQFRPLRREKFDISIDFQGLIKSAAIAKLSGARIRYGFDKSALREPASRIFLNRTAEIPSKTHVIRKNLALAALALEIAVPDSAFDFPIFTDEEHRLEAEQTMASVGDDFAILNPAGGWVTKLWPAENFGALADSLWEEHGLRSVVAIGPQEIELGEKVLNASRSGKALLIQPSLKGFYELAKRTRVYIGGDTGPTHLAVAAGAPILGIFGPTEWWRNGSPTPKDICVERLDIGCRIGCHRRTCSNWICMDIDVRTVMDAVTMRLGQNKSATQASNRPVGIS